ncbi:MAG: C-terminal binding protein [Thermoleophilia bacterium]|nr:C-terminal binding protein [Thermoleophilia bacterium]
MSHTYRVVVCGGTFRDLECERRILGAIGAEVVDANHLSREEVIEQVRDADAVMTDYFVVDAEVISRLERCQVICRYGIGVDKVDVEAATRAGIMVTRSPEYCVTELADHALALLLAVARRIVHYDADVRAGNWQWDSPGVRRISGATLGIVGLGRIGGLVAERAKPLGLRILAHDPLQSDDAVRARGAEPVSLEELLERSDFVSVHAPLMPQTRGLIGRAEIERMKPGAIIVNTARGPLIDQDALVEALAAGRLGGAGLDVLSPEPPAPDDPILSLPNVVITPHAGHFSEESLVQVQTEAAEEVLRALTGEPLLYAVNERELQRT